MFRNKILVRASPPPSSSFSLLPLSLPIAGDRSPPLSNSIDLQTLCCRLSRTWRLACFLHAGDIFVVYQRSQCESAARVVDELVRSIPGIEVGLEEEVRSSSLIAKAVEWWLRSIMFDNSWSCVGENCFIQSSFACSEERRHLCSINVTVQAETDDGLLFLVSPDVLWFKRHKLSDLASSQVLGKFENGEAVVLEEYGFSTSCKVLPSLYEGHVIGLSKLLPAGETVNRFEEFSLFKHGLDLPSNYFFNIQIRNGSHINRQWYPSAFALQVSGLAPAPQTVRTSKALQALEFFVNLIGDWDFFGQGLLKVKEVSSLVTSTLLPAWKTATSNLKDATMGERISYTGEVTRQQDTNLDLLQLSLDFHTPKPAFGCVFREKHADVHQYDCLLSDTRVKCPPDANVIKVASFAESISSEPKCVNKSNGTETSAVNFLSQITAAKSEYQKESNVSKKKDVSAEILTIKITHESSSTSESSVHEKTEVEKKLTSAEDCMSGVTAEESDLVSETSANEKKHNSSGDVIREVSRNGVSVQKVEVSVQSVIDYHSRGVLQSLTVPDLKSFLTIKNKKVGGKKEELVQRITDCLLNPDHFHKL
ncbi:uncharacterized protein A4U43_C07F36960 [Asparagus officinalis]|uniref:SAP domain-containing protein n=1 Tax=Asparagus officinalis TaxID=4686 RepID=A0A5P1EHL6_ASPOF|nr:uncharacterized protein A4U43_C07F36960 [Asparagus officinalis]